MLFVAWATSSVAGTVEQLGLMGFDEPRSHLIAALTLGSSAAAIAVLITGSRRTATLLGVVGLVAFFGVTLNEETVTALNASGLSGVFDPIGYTFSIFTFVVMSLVFAWAAASLALEVRNSLLTTWKRIRVTRRAHVGRRLAVGRVAGTLVVGVAVAASFTLFAQMIDYTPDIAFVRGGPDVGGLTGGGLDLPTDDPGDGGATPSLPPAGPSESSRPSGPPVTPAPGTTPVPSPASYPTTPIEAGGTLSVTPGAVATLGHGHFPKRTGASRVDHFTMPAPWTGGYSNTVDIYVRLPAGYDPAHVHYPTVYVTPNPYQAWTDAVRLNFTVDQLEASGDIPPMLYVFAPATGGPHAVTECIDSADGLQHWDTFMSSTLIAYIDSHYPTIASASARTIMGSSQGGYCSAHLLLRHPDAFNQEISFSGFYDAPTRVAGQGGGAAVFGGDKALMDAYSPILIAPKLPVDARNNLFFILAGLSSQDTFGPQMDTFTGILDQNGYARAVIETPFGHSWKTEEAFLPRALSLVGQRLVEQGVLQ